MIKTMQKQNNTLRINVAQLLKSLIGSTRTYEVAEEVEIAGKDRMVQGDVELTRTDNSILVHGILHFDVELTCGRCSNEFTAPLSLDIQEEYVPKINVNTGDLLSAPEDKEFFFIDERNVIDLLEAVQQYASLAMPIKPLCKPDCSGLCPVCGHNMNHDECTCPPQNIDPRWDKLRDMFSKRK